jgi:GTP pyrophosphokinase
MQTFDQLIKKIDKLGLNMNKKRINLAYEFARAAHEGQKRLSGVAYITHPVAVTYKVLDFSPDEDMVVAALLHDVSEDTPRTLDDIESIFGPGVRSLVRGLEKLAKVRAGEDESQVENLRKMFVSMASDLRVILIKLCDRWHNMETLEYMSEEKQKRIAKETLDIYVPIASRLGIYKIKSAMEDLCFKFMLPDVYRQIHDQLAEYGKVQGKNIEALENTLQKFLVKEGFKVKITSRIKSHYSIYCKLKRKAKTNVTDIFDIFALRVLVPDKFAKDGKEYTGDLYNILGAVHSNWTPLAKRFKDYVAVPKPNGYRSLHTTLIGLSAGDFNQPVEVQIRSKKMHEEAEFGIASHWLYKSNGKSGSFNWDKIKKLFSLSNKLPSDSDSRTSWVKALDELQAATNNNKELIEDLQIDMFNDRLFVLTPDGDVKDLPAGATPVDFAYAIHTDVGHKAYMAKVDGKAVPLDYELKNGQVVEILTRKNSEPNQYWLSFVRTSGAKTKIKSFFRNKDSEKNIKEGREMLNKYLSRINKSTLDSEYSILKNFGAGNLDFKARERVLEDVGAGLMLPSNVMRNVFKEDDLLATNDVEVPRMVEKASKKTPKIKGINDTVIVDGIRDLPVKLAACCKPNIKDDITGFVTRGDGVTVHKNSCRVLSEMEEKDRLIDVEWELTSNSKYKVSIEFELADRLGLLRDITQVVSDAGVNIIDISLGESEISDVKLRHFVIEVESYDQLSRLLDKLERIDNVISVRKVG